MFLRDLFRGEWRRPRLQRPITQAVPQAGWPLDKPLLRLAADDMLTIRDCVAGVHIFGASGSGKTSGSLAAIAKAALADGWGMLILTSKPGEPQQWIDWAKSAGREGDLLVIAPESGESFNFLDYLSGHPDPGASVASNIADLLTTLVKYAKPKSQSSETSEFFADAAHRFATFAIHLLRLAGERLTLDAIGGVITSAPSDTEAARDRNWRRETLCGRLLQQAELRTASLEDHEQLKRVFDFFLGEYPRMNERTRGDVVATLSALVFRFTERPFRDLIASDKGNTFIPELVGQGRIVILACPAITYQAAGRLFQIAFKHLVQQSILRRRNEDLTRPVAIIADEAQNFVTHADYQYQAMCRDFRACTIYATQSIDNYRDVVGSEASVEALLASLSLKIFHANAGRTNEWAEKLIAQDWRTMQSENMNHRPGGKGSGESFGSSRSEQLSPQVLASEFTRLRTGGTRNDKQVDAVVFQSGRRFNGSGRPFIRTAFIQQ